VDSLQQLLGSGRLLAKGRCGQEEKDEQGLPIQHGNYLIAADEILSLILDDDEDSLGLR
jgi:hypothetical protein